MTDIQQHFARGRVRVAGAFNRLVKDRLPVRAPVGGFERRPSKTVRKAQAAQSIARPEADTRTPIQYTSTTGPTTFSVYRTTNSIWTTWTDSDLDTTGVGYCEYPFTTGSTTSAIADDLTLVCTTTSSAALETWVVWNGARTNAATEYWSPEARINAPPSQEELEAQRAEAARYRRERDEANARAERLLVENLSLRQRDEYHRNGWFVVFGRNRMRYRIRKGTIGNIDVVNPAGDVVHRLCAHIAEQVPDADNMLAQKLLLEHDDESFHRMANVHSLTLPMQGALPPLLH